jgi:hypothetical protein
VSACIAESAPEEPGAMRQRFVREALQDICDEDTYIHLENRTKPFEPLALRVLQLAGYDV